jgi:hypothetical protein
MFPPFMFAPLLFPPLVFAPLMFAPFVATSAAVVIVVSARGCAGNDNAENPECRDNRRDRAHDDLLASVRCLLAPMPLKARITAGSRQLCAFSRPIVLAASGMVSRAVAPKVNVRESAVALSVNKRRRAVSQ